MKRFAKNAACIRVILILLMCLAAAIFSSGAALTQGATLSAGAVPDAYYEPFDSIVTVTVGNDSDIAIDVTGLMVEDTVIPGINTALKPQESRQFELKTRITDAMLKAGHFYVTVYYTYTDSQGLSVPSINQIMVPVRRLEDRVEANVRFALPDRPIGDEESVPVSYILENTGETDMVNAVLICYPEGYFTAPLSLPAGAYTVVKRSVAVSDLDKLSAKLTAQSAYSGKEYTLEQAYDGNLIELETSASEYGLLSADSEPPAEDPDSQPGAQNDGGNGTEERSASLSARQSGERILIRVSAGEKTLTDVQVMANGEPVRSLVILKAGLSAEIPFYPAAQSEADYVFSLKAADPDGETLKLTGDSLHYVPVGEQDAQSYTAPEESGLLDWILEAPRLTNIIIYGCAAVLSALILVSAVKHAKKRAALYDEEEDEAEEADEKAAKKDRRKEKA